MAASIFRAIANLRMVLDTETDADSPHNETTYAALREMIEILYKLAFSTGDVGTATQNPPDDATGILTDSGAAYDVDEHNGRTLLITSGLAKGNFYTIDDTTATTIICTGDNLYSDGVRSADDYEILFDLKTYSAGHNHDGLNSRANVGTINQAALKTSMSAVSASDANSNETLPGGQYGFYPQVKVGGAYNCYFDLGNAYTGTTYTTIIGLAGVGAGETAYAQQRYVTASGEIFWIFILRRKDNGLIYSITAAPDHVCFGNGGNPKALTHPFSNVYEEDGIFKFPVVQKDKFIEIADVEILVINPDKDTVLEIQKKAHADATGFIEAFTELYDVDDKISPVWPTELVTVSLPPDWDDAWRNGKTVKPIKKIIPKPDLIRTAGLKKKL